MKKLAKLAIVAAALFLTYGIVIKEKPKAKPALAHISTESASAPQPQPQPTAHAIRSLPPIEFARARPAPQQFMPKDPPPVDEDDPALRHEFKKAPRSLAEIPTDLLPRVREMYDSPQMLEILDYQLKTLGAIEDCVGDRIHSRGDLTVQFRFDTRGDIAAARDIDVKRSTLTEEDDEVAIECARKAHAGREMKAFEPDPYDPTLVWATVVSFPISTNRVYESILGQRS